MPKIVGVNVRLYGALLAAAGGLYVLSCAPGTLWQDSGLIQLRLWRGDIEGPLGLALSHPLFYIAASVVKWIPIGEIGFRANLTSALAGALAVANLGLLVRLYSGRVIPAIVAAVTLALAHTFWWHASVAETYTLWAALFTGELVALLQFERTGRVAYLYLLGLLNGMALAVHMLAIIPCLVYGLVVIGLLRKRRVRPAHAGLMATLWFLGAGPLLYLVVARMYGTGEILGTLASAAFGARWRADVLNMCLSPKMVRDSVLYIGMNFPSPNILLFLVGVAALWRAKTMCLFRAVVLILMAAFVFFAFRYTVLDRYAFFIPFYVTAAICIGLGADRVLQGGRGKWPLVLIGACVLLPVGVYAALPRIARWMDIPIGTRADVPYRDDYAYFLQPWKTGYRGADRFAREALESVARGAVIYADTTTVGPLLCAQEVDGRRGDVKIVTGVVRSEDAPAYGPELFEQLIEERSIYVTSDQAGYCPPFVLDGPYDLVRTGLLWRVSKR